MTEDTEL